jgi:hypothetical protein
MRAFHARRVVPWLRALPCLTCLKLDFSSSRLRDAGLEVIGGLTSLGKLRLGVRATRAQAAGPAWKLRGSFPFWRF